MGVLGRALECLTNWHSQQKATRVSLVSVAHPLVLNILLYAFHTAGDKAPKGVFEI